MRELALNDVRPSKLPVSVGTELKPGVERAMRNILLSGLSPAVCCSDSLVVRDEVSLGSEASFRSAVREPSVGFSGASPRGKVARCGESGERLSTLTGPRELAASPGPGTEERVGVREAASDCDRAWVGGSL